MATSQITSREYKLILNLAKFSDLTSGVELFRQLLRNVFNELELVEHFKKKKPRQVYYLDTQDHKLRRHDHVLRIREKKKENQAVLKYRSKLKADADKHLVEIDNIIKPKYEEDIVIKRKSTPGQIDLDELVSHFSLSYKKSYAKDEFPEFNSIQAIELEFPGFNHLQIDPQYETDKVNSLEVLERAYELDIFNLDGIAIETDLSFWFDSQQNPNELKIAEFSFKFKGIKNEQGERLFPSSILEKVHELYLELANNHSDWFDLSGSSTKTSFAYGQ